MSPILSLKIMRNIYAKMKLFFASGQTLKFMATLNTIISLYSQFKKGTELSKVLVNDAENFKLLISIVHK